MHTHLPTRSTREACQPLLFTLNWGPNQYSHIRKTHGQWEDWKNRNL